MSPPSTTRSLLLTRVEISHALLALVGIGVSVVLADRPVWLGWLAGVLLGAANVRLLGMIVQRITDGSTTTKSGAMLGLVLKLGAMAAAIGATMIWLKPQPLALLAGLTLSPATLVTIAWLAPPSPVVTTVAETAPQVGETGGAS